LNGAAVLAATQGDLATARSLFEESLALCREMGARRGIAGLLGNLGTVVHGQGDLVTARALYEESLALWRDLGDKWGLALSLTNLGNVACEQGDLSTARALYEKSLAVWREMGAKRGIATCLALLVGVEVAVAWAAAAAGAEIGADREGRKRAERRARVLGAVEALLESMDAILERVARLSYEHAVAAVRAQLGEEAFARAWQEGRAMSMEEAVAYALEEEAWRAEPELTKGLSAELSELQIEINPRKSAEAVAEITETDYFHSLQQRAAEIRSERLRDKPPQ
jgi:tetratricopeptide (TPR) repeat protein